MPIATPVFDGAKEADIEEMLDSLVAVAFPPAEALRVILSIGNYVIGCAVERHTSPEWAAWANGVAVRELDYHDTFLAAEYSHPGDNIPPILAVAQHARRAFVMPSGALRGS